METNINKECPSCGDMIITKTIFCPLCGYVMDSVVSETNDQNIILQEEKIAENSKFEKDDNKKKKYLQGENSKNIKIAISLILSFILLLFFIIPQIESNYQKPTHQTERILPTQTKKIILTPTISMQTDKEDALILAEDFVALMEVGSEEMKEYLSPSSYDYKDNLELVAAIVHDTKKYGEYIIIYDLSIIEYSNQRAIISGYLEDRSRSYWLKYYIKITLSKYDNSWRVSSWELIKT